MTTANGSCQPSTSPQGSSQQGSFQQGVGEWVGSAEVYDAAGRYAGAGRDQRTVVSDDGSGEVTVDVSFDGPFSMAGRYTIADRSTHRLYQGPLNYGFADALGPGLIDANNYWPDLGLSQRFFLMVVAGGDRQMSLALLRAGERLRWVVVGEYQRRVDVDGDEPPEVGAIDVDAVASDPTAGRGVVLAHRAGRWHGRLDVRDERLGDVGTTSYAETIETDGAAGFDCDLAVTMTNMGFGADAAFALRGDALGAHAPAGPVVGSYSLWGGRGLAGDLHFTDDELRMWRREVISRDGGVKAVVHTWYRGGARVGVVSGLLQFEPAP